jgi:hypothetical protein
MMVAVGFQPTDCEHKEACVAERRLNYIRGQGEHHRVKTCEENYTAFLVKYQIALTKFVPLPSIRGLKTHGYRHLVAPRRYARGERP